MWQTFHSTSRDYDSHYQCYSIILLNVFNGIAIFFRRYSWYIIINDVNIIDINIIRNVTDVNIIIVITSAKEVIFLPVFIYLFVCLSVSLLARLRQNYNTDFHQIFIPDMPFAM